jgi:hypothetical protein
MARGFNARITPLGGGSGGSGGEIDNTLPGIEGPVDPDYGIDIGAHPAHPIVIPPIPGIWPPPGKPTLPIVIPPTVWPPSGGVVMPPIYIEPTPEHPITLPPGQVYPPLPPEYAGKLVLVVVVGEGKAHWYMVPPPTTWPPTSGPK